MVSATGCGHQPGIFLCADSQIFQIPCSESETACPAQCNHLGGAAWRQTTDALFNIEHERGLFIEGIEFHVKWPLERSAGPVFLTYKESPDVFVCDEEYSFCREYRGESFIMRRHYMRRMCEKAGVPPFGFHVIRHLVGRQTVLYGKAAGGRFRRF